MAQRGPKKQKQAFSFMIETGLFLRLKKAALELNFTMTDIIHNNLEQFLDEHDKYYDPNEIQQGEEEEIEEPRQAEEPQEEDYENPDRYEDPPGIF